MDTILILILVQTELLSDRQLLRRLALLPLPGLPSNTETDFIYLRLSLTTKPSPSTVSSRTPGELQCWTLRTTSQGLETLSGISPGIPPSHPLASSPRMICGFADLRICTPSRLHGRFPRFLSAGTPLHPSSQTGSLLLPYGLCLVCNNPGQVEG